MKQLSDPDRYHRTPTMNGKAVKSLVERTFCIRYEIALAKERERLVDLFLVETRITYEPVSCEKIVSTIAKLAITCSDMAGELVCV